MIAGPRLEGNTQQFLTLARGQAERHDDEVFLIGSGHAIGAKVSMLICTPEITGVFHLKEEFRDTALNRYTIESELIRTALLTQHDQRSAVGSQARVKKVHCGRVGDHLRNASVQGLFVKCKDLRTQRVKN